MPGNPTMLSRSATANVSKVENVDSYSADSCERVSTLMPDRFVQRKESFKGFALGTEQSSWSNS